MMDEFFLVTKVTLTLLLLTAAHVSTRSFFFCLSGDGAAGDGLKAQTGCGRGVRF
jgi:hypothetical protein